MAEFAEDPTADLPFAHGGPCLHGVLRASPEDFRVTENLGYGASGEGEHAFLTIRKRGQNTMEVARALAGFAGVRLRDVGFAGLKDRHAVTTQSFSVHLPGKPDPDWQQFPMDGVQVIAAGRHHRKIRRGSLRGNSFELVLRQLSGDREQAELRLLSLQKAGAPNYFGIQRFGRNASNLQRVAEHFKGEGRRLKPEQRRMLYSAARSYLFNAVLAARVADNTWNQLLDGEVALRAGSGGQFLVEVVDQSLQARIADFDIHPSGPLPGQASRALQPQAQALAFEQTALQALPQGDWVDALAAQRIDADRRPLRLLPEQFDWQWSGDDTLTLRFALLSGSYATAVVRELCVSELA